MDNVFSIQYSLPYLLYLFFLTGLLAWEYIYKREAKDIRLIMVFNITSFIVFYGLRGYVLSDWINYYNLFEEIPTIWETGFGNFNTYYVESYQTDVFQQTAGMEIGFIYFTYILKSIFPNYHIWVLINTLIDILILHSFFKRYSKSYILGFILFFVFGGVMIEMNLMRNVKAILLFIISIKYLKNQKIVPYMALNLVGYMFHSSAIIFFPLYFILNREWSAKLFWAIFIIGNVLYLFQIQYVAPILTFISGLFESRMSLLTQLYLESDLYSRSYGISIGYIERVITFVIIMIYRKELISKDSNNIIFINLYILYFISYFFFSELLVVVERLSLLFIISYWILYPNIINLIDKTKIKILFISLLLFYSVIKISMTYSNILSKYDNVLFGMENYEIRQKALENNLDDLLNNP